MSKNNPFAKISDAPAPTGGGAYIEPGEHVLEVEAMKIVSNDHEGKQHFVAEFALVESDNDGMSKKVSFVRELPGKFNYGLTDARACIAAALGVPFEEVDTELASGVCTDEGQEMVKGRKVACTAIMKKTKTGGDFTKCQFRAHDAA